VKGYIRFIITGPSLAKGLRAVFVFKIAKEEYLSIFCE